MVINGFQPACRDGRAADVLAQPFQGVPSQWPKQISSGPPKKLSSWRPDARRTRSTNAPSAKSFTIPDALSLIKKILIHLWHDQLRLQIDANAKLDHQAREFIAVDQTDRLGRALDVAHGLRRERRSCQNHALVRRFAVHRAGEVADFRCTDGAFPSLGLNINTFQFKAIEVEDAVDAAVAGLAAVLRAPELSCVAHLVQQLQHGALEESG